MGKLYICVILTTLLTAAIGCGEKVVVPEEVRNAIAIPSGNHDFDTCKGDRNFQRIPLKYPYQLSNNYDDGVKAAAGYFFLTRVTPHQGVKNAAPILYLWLKAAAPAEEFVAFEQMQHSEAMLDYDRFGIFYYDTGECQLFSSKAEITEAIKAKYGESEERLTFYSFDELFQYFEAVTAERD